MSTFLFMEFVFYVANGIQFLCDNELECIGDLASTANDYVLGYAYKSVFQSPTTTTYSRNCDGAFSCAETPRIDTNDLLCSGPSSCSNVEFATAGVIWAEGSNS
eukprot:106996_1